MSTKEQPALRAVVRRAMLGARTAEQVNEAEALLREWLDAHPDDNVVRAEASGLYRMKEAIERTSRAS